jgi:hypothetical protein
MGFIALTGGVILFGGMAAAAHWRLMAPGARAGRIGAAPKAAIYGAICFHAMYVLLDLYLALI